MSAFVQKVRSRAAAGVNEDDEIDDFSMDVSK
jgi:hypothetical protein